MSSEGFVADERLEPGRKDIVGYPVREDGRNEFKVVRYCKRESGEPQSKPTLWGVYTSGLFNSGNKVNARPARLTVLAN